MIYMYVYIYIYTNVKVVVRKLFLYHCVQIGGDHTTLSFLVVLVNRLYIKKNNDIFNKKYLTYRIQLVLLCDLVSFLIKNIYIKKIFL
jgi:hypothetical protein